MKKSEYKLLIQHKNSLVLKLKNIKLEIDRNENTISSLISSDLSKEYVKNKISNLEESIKEKNKTKELLEFRIEEVEKGNLDEDLYKEDSKQIKKIQEIKRNSYNKQKEDLEKKANDKDKYNKIISKDIIEKKDIRSKNYEAKKGYYYFTNVSESLPDYLSAKLEKMPMNKGYKYRGVIFFGKLPSEEETFVIFERINKEILHIHTWDENWIYVHEKKGNHKKTLISKSRRNTKKENCLGDYIKFQSRKTI